MSDEHDLVRHNMAVFKQGENALKVFPPLIELYPEAKMNLIIYYLNNGEVENAFRLSHDLEPLSPKQYILKAVVFTLYGQNKGSSDIINQALDFYKLIGTSASECDTVSGRQATACYMFLKKQFEDVVLYLNTIKEYMKDDDDFNWNYGIGCAVIGKFKEAESALAQIQNEKYHSDYMFISWLAKCYIVNGKPELAWNLYLEMDTSNETLSLLKIIGNDCYKFGWFYHSLKAFDILERLDNEEYVSAKVGAAVGIFKDFLKQKEPSEHLEEALQILKSSAHHPNIEHVVRVIENYISAEE